MNALGSLRCGLASLTALIALGCGKTGQTGSPELATGEAGAGFGGAATVLEPEVCRSPQPGPSPLRRLDGFQLANTLRDLFRDAPTVVAQLEPTLARLPLGNIYDDVAGPPQQGIVDVYHQLAHEAALAVSSNATALAGFVGCAPESMACREQFVKRFLARTSRRPPTSDEVAEALTVFEQGQALGGGAFASGVRAVVEVALQGPDFLYLVERGEGDAEAGSVALSSYETATRLAYLLTGSMPDAELLADADTGPFTDARVEAQARRLLGSLASRREARHFMESLLGYGEVVEPLGLDHPSYTPEIAALTREESGRFVEDVVFDGAGTFRALLAERSTWLNGPLAEFYGIAGVSGDAFQKVDVSRLPRAGILTQSAFLTATSPTGRPNPVARGLRVLRKLLCVEPPAPPAGVPVVPPEDADPGSTQRERLELATSGLPCSDCHRDINPVGYAFENYDGVGLWRELDNGQPIDASGTLRKTDAQGEFVGAVELVERLAKSRDAEGCFARSWLVHAYGRPEAEADACARRDVEAAFRQSDGNVVELLVALAKTDQLRYRLASELTP